MSVWRLPNSRPDTSAKIARIDVARLVGSFTLWTRLVVFSCGGGCPRPYNGMSLAANLEQLSRVLRYRPCGFALLLRVAVARISRGLGSEALRASEGDPRARRATTSATATIWATPRAAPSSECRRPVA